MDILHFIELGDTESFVSCSSARRVSDFNGNVPRGGGGYIDNVVPLNKSSRMPHIHRQAHIFNIIASQNASNNNTG